MSRFTAYFCASFFCCWSAAHGAVEIVHAWYGLSKKNSRDVAGVLRAQMQETKQDAFWVSPDMNGMFGDPIFGKEKKLEIALRFNGTPVKPDIELPEGIGIHWTPDFIVAEPLDVYNETDVALYVQVFYKSGDKVTPVGNSVRILPQHMHRINRPGRKSTTRELFGKKFTLPAFDYDDRELAFSTEESQLAAAARSGHSVNVGDKWYAFGRDFHIALNHKNQLEGYSSDRWAPLRSAYHAARKTVDSLASMGKAKIREIVGGGMPAIENNPFKREVGKVRVGNELCADERQAFQGRLAHVRESLQRNLSINVDAAHTPKIFVIASGGGYRAMIATLGFLVGLEKTGLLDYVSYFAGLSGSAWLLGAYMDAKAKNPAMTVEEFKRNFLARIAGKWLIDINATDKKEAIGLIVDALRTELAFGRDVTLVDLYGMFLANRFFTGSERQMQYTSAQRSLSMSGKTPIPLYTTVQGESGVAQAQLGWYEATPFEFGGAWLGHYIPTQFMGRACNNGVTIDDGVEAQLGFILGSCGSAFAINYRDVAAHLVEEGVHTGVGMIDTFIAEKLLPAIASPDVIAGPGGARFTAAKLFNFTFGMPSSPIKYAPEIKIVDAGLSITNIPYPPVSGERPERSPDIIMVLDISRGIAGAPALKGAEQYARSHGLLLPKIDYNGIETRACSIFKEPGTPTVLYFPLIKGSDFEAMINQDASWAPFQEILKNFDPAACIDKDFCGTTNFTYAIHEAEQLSALPEFNMRSSKGLVEAVIREVIVGDGDRVRV